MVRLGKRTVSIFVWSTTVTALHTEYTETKDFFSRMRDIVRNALRTLELRMYLIEKRVVTADIYRGTLAEYGVRFEGRWRRKTHLARGVDFIQIELPPDWRMRRGFSLYGIELVDNVGKRVCTFEMDTHIEDNLLKVCRLSCTWKMK